jgi:hypothetical protein
MLPKIVWSVNVTPVRHRHMCTRLHQTGNAGLFEETKVDNSILENFRTTGWPNRPAKRAKKCDGRQHKILTFWCTGIKRACVEKELMAIDTWRCVLCEGRDCVRHVWTQLLLWIPFTWSTILEVSNQIKINPLHLHQINRYYIRYQNFFIYQLMHNWIVLKTILKFTLKLTLKQLRHVSVQSPSSAGALFELAKVTVVKIIN